MGRPPLVRVHDLYLDDFGRWSAAAKTYRGVYQHVAAESGKQAALFAQNNVWATDADRPVGILYRYNRDGAPVHRLWCGCPNPGATVLHHGDGITKIREFMATHSCPRREAP